MVALKAAQSASYIRSPTEPYAAMLVYGPDASLVAERTRELVRNLSRREEPAAEVLRLDDRDLADNPDILAIELQMQSLFAARRIVQLNGERRLVIDRLRELLEGELTADLVVEAGNLSPSSSVRKLFESDKRTVALPCYSDPVRDLSPLIDSILAASGVSATREVRAYLLSRLGTDIGVARSECGKLATYVGEGGAASVDDVDAIVGDIDSGVADALVNAVAEGRARIALKHFESQRAAGQGAHAALAALSRHFQRLHRLCAAVEAGKPAKSVISSFRPPPHFKLQDALLAQSRKWSERDAAQMLQDVHLAMRLTRLSPGLDDQIVERLLLSACQGETAIHRKI